MTFTVRHHYVPVEPFREAFLKMEPPPRAHPGLAPKDAGQLVAARLGWFHHKGCPDGPRVRRVLGLRPYPRGNRYVHEVAIRRWITYDTALRLCEAMDLDPVDLDL